MDTTTNGTTPQENVSRIQVENKFGIPGWAIADITKRMNIQPTYARLSREGKRPALHALYTPLQVIQIRAEYDRIKKEGSERRSKAAKERFNSATNPGKVHASRMDLILAAVERIERRQVRVEQHLNMQPTFTKSPIASDYVPTTGTQDEGDDTEDLGAIR